MILAIAILLTVGLFGYALLVPQQVEHSTEKTRVAYLRERRDVLYDNLRDLNFEHRAGKLPDADYQSMRAAMEEEAALLLSEIESLESLRPDGAGPVSSWRSK